MLTNLAKHSGFSGPGKMEDRIIEVYKNTREIFKNPTLGLIEELFTPSCSYITFQGQHLTGHEAIYTAHKKLADSWFFRGSNLILEVESITFLNETTAVLIGKGGILFRWQKGLPSSRLSINTNVFLREGNRWRIASFQNTRISARGLLERLLIN